MNKSLKWITSILVILLIVLLAVLIYTNTQEKDRYDVDQINNAVKSRIAVPFTEDAKVVILTAPNHIISALPGEDRGVAFAIKNKLAEQEFTWKVNVEDNKTMQKCNITKEQADSWIFAGSTGKITIGSNQTEYGILRIKVQNKEIIPGENCIIRYEFHVKKADGSPYYTLPFDVQVIKEKSFWCKIFGC